jgi:beta-N-acetylhexosaminidase
MYNAEHDIGADLTVVPAEGWTRDMWRDETALPWVKPSPNIPRLEAAIHYPGTVFFEAVNVSEGRGTDAPFEQIGAPWLDNQRLAAEMDGMALPGVRFEAADIPVAETGRKYPGETLKGVRLVLTDREVYRPITVSLLMIAAIRQMHPDEFEWRGANQRDPGLLTIERHGGTAKLKQAIDNGTLPVLLEAWEEDQARFAELREPYLIYR